MIEQVEGRKIPVQPQSDVIRIIISSVGEDQRLAFFEQERNSEPVIAPLPSPVAFPDIKVSMSSSRLYVPRVSGLLVGLGESCRLISNGDSGE